MNCWEIIHCLEVSCKEDQITIAQREWFIFVQLTNKQWIITQQFTHWSWSISKAIKNATGTSVIFPINISLLHFVFVLTSVPNVGERFTKTWAQLHSLPKLLVKNDKFIKFFGNHIKSWNFIQFQHASTAFHSNKQKKTVSYTKFNLLEWPKIYVLISIFVKIPQTLRNH